MDDDRHEQTVGINTLPRIDLSLGVLYSGPPDHYYCANGCVMSEEAFDGKWDRILKELKACNEFFKKNGFLKQDLQIKGDRGKPYRAPQHLKIEEVLNLTRQNTRESGRHVTMSTTWGYSTAEEKQNLERVIAKISASHPKHGFAMCNAQDSVGVVSEQLGGALGYLQRGLGKVMGAAGTIVDYATLAPVHGVKVGSGIVYGTDAVINEVKNITVNSVNALAEQPVSQLVSNLPVNLPLVGDVADRNISKLKQRYWDEKAMAADVVYFNAPDHIISHGQVHELAVAKHMLENKYPAKIVFILTKL